MVTHIEYFNRSTKYVLSIFIGDGHSHRNSFPLAFFCIQIDICSQQFHLNIYLNTTLFPTLHSRNVNIIVLIDIKTSKHVPEEITCKYDNYNIDYGFAKLRKMKKVWKIY